MYEHMKSFMIVNVFLFPYLKRSVQQTSEFPNVWMCQCKQVIEGRGLCAGKVKMTFSFNFLCDLRHFEFQ